MSRKTGIDEGPIALGVMPVPREAAAVPAQPKAMGKAREMAEAFWSELPLWKVPLMAQGKVGEAAIRQLLEEVQATQLA